ncbi:MAG: hypothetical protein ACRDWS_04270 [Acidimicrobiia bacterium]
MATDLQSSVSGTDWKTSQISAHEAQVASQRKGVVSSRRPSNRAN